MGETWWYHPVFLLAQFENCAVWLVMSMWPAALGNYEK